MSNRVLCKFFAHGACLKGDHCEFSHDWCTPQNNVRGVYGLIFPKPKKICTFYQKGMCAYGSRCRYDHIKVSLLQAQSHVSSSLSQPASSSASSLATNASRSSPLGEGIHDFGQPTVYSSWTESFSPSDRILRSHPSEDILVCEQELGHKDTSTSASDHPICAFAAAGNCPRVERCPHVHGDLCEICGKHCLHPHRPEERNEHIKQCQRNKKNLEALKKSQEIECCVCLDRVLTKPTAAERKFGLLSECDHPFCISCIRNWRSNSPSSGMDVNSTLRACPICRKLSYFVIPSVIWYSSPEEKQEIVDSYKSKLKSIDCKYFDFGSGNCPFGTSCFYKHAYRDGSIEEVKLRHLGAEDGLTVIQQDIRLADFFRGLQL